MNNQENSILEIKSYNVSAMYRGWSSFTLIAPVLEDFKLINVSQSSEVVSVQMVLEKHHE